jgi:hypothetical protein
MAAQLIGDAGSKRLPMFVGHVHPLMHRRLDLCPVFAHIAAKRVEHHHANAHALRVSLEDG